MLFHIVHLRLGGEIGGPPHSGAGDGASGTLRRERLNSADMESGVVHLPKKKKRRTKLQRQSTLIRTEVDSLPSFWPIFIVLVSVAQVVPLCLLSLMVYSNHRLVLFAGAGHLFIVYNFKSVHCTFTVLKGVFFIFMEVSPFRACFLKI